MSLLFKKIIISISFIAAFLPIYIQSEIFDFYDPSNYSPANIFGSILNVHWVSCLGLFHLFIAICLLKSKKPSLMNQKTTLILMLISVFNFIMISVTAINIANFANLYSEKIINIFQGPIALIAFALLFVYCIVLPLFLIKLIINNYVKKPKQSG